MKRNRWYKERKKLSRQVFLHLRISQPIFGINTHTHTTSSTLPLSLSRLVSFKFIHLNFVTDHLSPKAEINITKLTDVVVVHFVCVCICCAVHDRYSTNKTMQRILLFLIVIGTLCAIDILSLSFDNNNNGYNWRLFKFPYLYTYLSSANHHRRVRRTSVAEHFAQLRHHSVNRVASMREGVGRRDERSRTATHSRRRPTAGVFDIDEKAKESLHRHHPSLNGVEVGARDLIETPGFREGSNFCVHLLVSNDFCAYIRFGWRIHRRWTGRRNGTTRFGLNLVMIH